MKTIAQQIKWDFETNGDLILRDKNVNIIYREFSNGRWAKCEYDSQGNRIYYEDSKGKIIDNRPKPCEDKEIVIGGEKFKLVKL